MKKRCVTVGSLKIASGSLIRCIHLRSGRWKLGNHPPVAPGPATGGEKDVVSLQLIPSLFSNFPECQETAVVVAAF